MTDEEKAEVYADKILSDSKYPFILSKEKVKAYIIKVYLDSFNKGLAEGRKEKECFEQNKDGTLKPCNVMKDNTTLRCKKENLERENSELKAQIEQLSNDNHVLKTSFITQQTQIEKMENCWNCKFFKEKKYQACIDFKKNNTKCCTFYKWELAE